LKAGDFDEQALLQRLVHVALTDEDESVRHAAAGAAGHVFSASSWANLREVVEGADVDAGLRAAAAVHHYLRAAAAPRTPRVATAEFDDEGGMRLSVQLGEAPDPLPAEVPAT